MSAHGGTSSDEAWASLRDEALVDEIRSNQRSERRLLVVVGLVATTCTVVIVLLHRVIS